MMMNTNNILDRFLNNELEQIFCEKCLNTFLTNVYDLGKYVLLEKYSLGLEYYRHAIQIKNIKRTPELAYLGVVDDMTGTRLPDNTIKLFTHEEPDYRLIYVMEKLQDLPIEDEQFFTDYVHEMDWMNERQRHEVLNWVAERYGQGLAEDIRQLCRYHREHSEHVVWDLHGDNLMMRPSSGEILILDPFTLSAETLDSTHC